MSVTTWITTWGAQPFFTVTLEKSHSVFLFAYLFIVIIFKMFKKIKIFKILKLLK